MSATTKPGPGILKTSDSCGTAAEWAAGAVPGLGLRSRADALLRACLPVPAPRTATVADRPPRPGPLTEPTGGTSGGPGRRPEARHGRSNETIVSLTRGGGLAGAPNGNWQQHLLAYRYGTRRHRARRAGRAGHPAAPARRRGRSGRPADVWPRGRGSRAGRGTRSASRRRSPPTWRSSAPAGSTRPIESARAPRTHPSARPTACTRRGPALPARDPGRSAVERIGTVTYPVTWPGVGGAVDEVPP